MLEQIIISTCPNRAYIHQTLRAIKADDLPIFLVMDSLEDYLPEYNFTKVLKTTNDGDAKERALRNYCRCLMLAEGKNTLILEDDVELRDDWRRDLKRFVAYVERVYSKYVLSIGEHWCPLGGFQSGAMVRGPLQIDFGLVREPVQTIIDNKALLCLAGTQARYYPKTLPIKEIVSTILNGFKETPILYDLLLGKYLFETQTKIFISQYPLIRHIGQESTLGTEIHAPLD
ncbi:MAG: hypothetical protein M0R80_00835 [Proteobacteria bacterium]|nr:hypothetical protein [Pseudomonadota bacterium]